MCTHKSYFKEYENSVLQCPMVHNISTYQAPRYSWFLQLSAEALSFPANLLYSDKIYLQEDQKELDYNTSVSYNTGERIERSLSWHVLLS